MSNAVVIIHGGGCSGARQPSETKYKNVLKSVLQQAHRELASEQSAVNIVTNVVALLEESGQFVAGKGSPKNQMGEVELDASIMDGSSRDAGSIAAAKNILHPIKLARLVMQSSPHVMLTGAGANNFAKQQKVEFVNNPGRYYSYAYKHNLEYAPDPQDGTVGAVALDTNGNLASATSTGGTANKRQGRVGDSPIIGAGTWADTNVAVSCTGRGEFFIRCAAAHAVAAQVAHATPLHEASQNVINEIISFGGYGGLIAVDRDGDIATPFHASKTGSMTYGFTSLLHPEPQVFP